MPRKGTKALEPEQGSNAPAEIIFDRQLDDLELEAKNWLDDEPLSSQQQADTLTSLIDAAAKLAAEIEATRKAEKEPFLEGGRAVDAKFKPLSERADKYYRKMKNKVGNWLKLVAAENQRRAREAEEERRKAEQQLREEHERNRQSDSIADDDALKAAEERAEQARIDAARIARTKATSSAGSTNVKLRKFWMVNIVDRRECLKFYLQRSHDGSSEFADDLKALLQKHAETDVRKHGARSIPGCNIWDEDRPV